MHLNVKMLKKATYCTALAGISLTLIIMLLPLVSPYPGGLPKHSYEANTGSPRHGVIDLDQPGHLGQSRINVHPSHERDLADLVRSFNHRMGGDSIEENVHYGNLHIRLLASRSTIHQLDSMAGANPAVPYRDWAGDEVLNTGTKRAKNLIIHSAVLVPEKPPAWTTPVMWVGIMVAAVSIVIRICLSEVVDYKPRRRARLPVNPAGSQRHKENFKP